MIHIPHRYKDTSQKYTKEASYHGTKVQLFFTTGLKPYFYFRLPEERGAINIYNTNTQAAPSTRLYTKGVALVLKSMKDEHDKITGFHIQTTASERVTLTVPAAYKIDSERVYTHLFANRELGFSGAERWRRQDVMKIISHRLAPLKESPTIITFLCNVVNVHGDHHHVELPVAHARECNEREVVGYIFQHHLEYCSGTQWIRTQWPSLFDEDLRYDSDNCAIPRAINALSCTSSTHLVRYNRNYVVRPDHRDSHYALLDSGADTTGLGGDIWVDIKKTGRHAGILAYNNELLMDEVPIVSATAAHDLPDSTTIVLQFNETTLLAGENQTL